MLSLNKAFRRFSIPKATLITALTMPETPIAWGWDGFGQGGFIVTRRPDLTVPNSPSVGVTAITQRRQFHPFTDIYALYFSTIPARFFDHASVSFDATTAFFDLNLEE